MNCKKGLLILVVAVAGITVGALAEKQTSGKRVTLLRAGLVSAELRVEDANQVQIQSTGNTQFTVDAKGDNQPKQATGGFLLKIPSGTNAISIQAEDAIFDFEPAQRQSTSKRVYRLRAGSAYADLIVDEGTKMSLQGSSGSASTIFDFNNRTLWATNGAILKIGDGTNSISVQADEIIGAPYTK